ncbi:hypothetical protein BH09PAT1_BH09PAT1_3630 [soil metagenome]
MNMSEEKKVAIHKPLPDPIELAKEAWIVYKSRFWTVVGITLLGMLVVFVAAIIAILVGVVLFFILGAKVSPQLILVESVLAVLVIVMIVYASNWIQASTLLAFKNWNKKIGVKESFALGRAFILPLFLTALLHGLISFGAFLFFIIPAFIFGVWFEFFQYVVVFEGKSKLLALHTSREYVKGRFWGVFWRVIAIHIPAFILGIIFTRGADRHPGPVQGVYQLISLLLVPFYMSYSYVLFSHLQKTAHKVEKIIPSKSKLAYLLIPILGYALVIITGVLVLPTAIRAISQMATSVMEQQQSTAPQQLRPSTKIVNGLVIYYLANKKFPSTMDAIINEKSLPSIPTDDKTGLPYRYTELDNGANFKLCSPTGVKPEKCVTAESKNFDL